MKIYFAGGGGKKGVSLTKQNAKHRLMSYYFLRTLKNDPQYVKRYVETGIGDKK